ncbi:hypothetical protein FH972_008389 [Carpinus fangiana]|uniref:Uncharacterized protein n=1 Tax=Carpinus fangiana TaxID=176857 RepID=A0A5N6QYH9_9ROSI|nr:hypothetical protein FH972_008389 [Carpinus fangiana]
MGSKSKSDHPHSGDGASPGENNSQKTNAACGQSSPSTLKDAFSKYWFVSYSQLANVFMSRYFMYMKCLD